MLVFILNLFVALVISAGVWYVGSWALALLIYRVETKAPSVVEKPGWSAVMTGSNLGIFVVSIVVWISLAWFFQQLSR